MARWEAIAAEQPAFAQAVQVVFDAYRHKVIATLRRDGSPRVSGIEMNFEDGDVWFGSMPGSRKSADIARDPRIAVHSSSEDPPEDAVAWQGDAKLSGRAIEVQDPERLKAMGGGEDGGTLYRIEVSEVVLTRIGESGDYLAIDVWREGRGLTRMRAS